MALALFDLDDTLVSGNCETEWFHFLSDSGLIPEGSHLTAFNEYDRLYVEGQLDIMDYMRFILKPLVDHDLATLERLHQQYINERIKPLIPKASFELVKKHRDQGDVIVIITACNDFNAGPVVELFEVEHLIATEAEVIDGRYTGEALAPASFAEGKVTRLKQWIENNQQDLAGSYFYSDSRNDIPLMELADFPVAVDPDPYLTEFARQRDWPIINLHNKS